MSLYFPEILLLFSNPVNLIFSAKYEHLYFQTDNELDKYHHVRDDKVITFNSDVKYQLTDSISLKYYYKFKDRETSSPYTNVEIDKKYTLYETGFFLGFSLF